MQDHFAKLEQSQLEFALQIKTVRQQLQKPLGDVMHSSAGPTKYKIAEGAKKNQAHYLSYGKFDAEMALKNSGKKGD